MSEQIPIREYEQAVYVFWYGPETPSVKIGHTNNPDRRLDQLRNDTGVPGHLASMPLIVWLDRLREKVEAHAHEMAAAHRKDGEWFELTATEALRYIVDAAEELNIRYEIEDRAGLLHVVLDEIDAAVTWEAVQVARRLASQASELREAALSKVSEVSDADRSKAQAAANQAERKADLAFAAAKKIHEKYMQANPVLSAEAQATKDEEGRTKSVNAWKIKWGTSSKERF